MDARTEVRSFQIYIFEVRAQIGTSNVALPVTWVLRPWTGYLRVKNRVKAQPLCLILSFLDFTEHLGDVIPFGRPYPRNF
jgi:hypothetical protein